VIFLVFTHIPTKQGFLGPIPGKIEKDECEAETYEEVKIRTHVPLNGTVFIVPKDAVMIVEARTINEVVSGPTTTTPKSSAEGT
jgi:hypothetical protein